MRRAPFVIEPGLWDGLNIVLGRTLATFGRRRSPHARLTAVRELDSRGFKGALKQVQCRVNG